MWSRPSKVFHKVLWALNRRQKANRRARRGAPRAHLHARAAGEINPFSFLKNYRMILVLLCCFYSYMHPQDSSARTETSPPVSLQLQDIPLRDALSMLAEQGQVRLIYADDLVTGVLVTCQFKRLSVDQALKRLLRHTPLTFRKLQNNHIVLMRRTQSSLITGRVVDRKTGEPLTGASVFLANTTMGVMTDADGRYRIKQIPPSAYTLIVSHIGYELHTIPVQLIRPDTLHYLTRLKPRVLDTVGVLEVTASKSRKPDLKRWRKGLKRFTKEFIGTSQYAEACRIINPEILSFSRRGPFQAYADSIIRIDNTAFGYRLHVILDSFYSTDDYIRYTVYPRFEALKPGSEKERKQWYTNRRRAYQGSYEHFLRALGCGRLNKERFAVTLKGHPPVTIIQNNHRLNSPSGSGRFIDISAIVVPDGSGLRRIQFVNYLWVRYGSDESAIKLNEPYALIDTVGNLHTPQAFTKYGAWWLDRIGDLLPVDYQPLR